MNQVSASALASAQSTWSSVAQTGIIGHVPAFQPQILNQPLQAIAERTDWLDAEFREAYMESCVEQNIAWQIRFNRQARGLDQSELAALINTGQSAISRIEDTSYGRINIKTILKVANAFKCALSIKFISYAQLAEETKSFSKENLIVESFDEQLKLIKG
jgi:transcriptional regulator with XRE-family HTH domain